jgi:hypothetical protein
MMDATPIPLTAMQVRIRPHQQWNPVDYLGRFPRRWGRVTVSTWIWHHGLFIFFVDMDQDDPGAFEDLDVLRKLLERILAADY